MKDIPIKDKLSELELAIIAAKNAIEKILEVYNGNFKISQKSDDSPVTDADLKSNETIKKFSQKQDIKYYQKKIKTTKVD